MDNEFSGMTDRELLEQMARDMATARQLAEGLVEQFAGITQNPKFALFAKMLGMS